LPEAYLLVQLTIHGLFRRFTIINSPLRKLPGVLPIALSPQYLPVTVTDHDADIGTKSVAIYHVITL
jgi:hypothetical protein